jgi:hypothetical protein
MLLRVRRDRKSFAGQDCGDPFRGPCPFRGIIDHGERLQGDTVGTVVGQRAAEIVPVATHGNGRGANAAAEIEGEHLGCSVAPELQGHQRQQHRLAGAGRANDQGMTDIADMKRVPERGRALGLGNEQRGRTEMLVPFRPRPHRR